MNGKILIVEDEAIIALIIEKLLLSLGHEVCGTTASGEEALTQAEALKPDLVLMDIRLSGEMDGIEAADQVEPLEDEAQPGASQRGPG